MQLDLSFKLVALLCTIPTAIFVFKNRFINNMKVQYLDLMKDGKQDDNKNYRLDYRILSKLLYNMDDWVHLFMGQEDEVIKKIEFDKTDAIRGLGWFSLSLIFTLLSICSHYIAPSLGFLLATSTALIILYSVSTHYQMESIMNKLWEIKYGDVKQTKKRIPNRFTAALGYIDRIIYALFFAVQLYSVIGVWFGVKIANRLIGRSGIKSEEEYKEEGERKNLYLIGNVISLALGILGGILIKPLFNIAFLKRYLGI